MKPPDSVELDDLSLKGVHSAVLCVCVMIGALPCWKESTLSVVFVLMLKLHMYEICAQHLEPDPQQRYTECNLSYSLPHAPNPEHKKCRNTIISLIWSAHSADFNCLFMLFYLLCLIILETNLSACLQMAELRIILIHTHTRCLHAYPFFFFSHAFSTPTLITALAYRPQKLPRVNVCVCHMSFNIERGLFHSSGIHVTAAVCTKPSRHVRNHRCDRFVLLITAN